jgi:hypothetical protein
MGSDKARVSYNPSRQYRSVVMQQGRVTLEADWNEAQQITSEQTRLEALDFVGPTGTPDNGYAISLINSSFDFQIGPGIMYVGGMRASLPTGLNYSQQPQNDWMDAANDPAWVPVPNAAPTGNEYVYLFLREQEISAIEDADLRDVALGGPDTAQRTRLVQHVVRLATTGNNCPTAFAAAQTTWAGEGFTLNPDSSVSSFAQLQVSFVPPSTPATPCDPTAKSGYLGADNQLIRVQVSDSKASPQCLLWGYNDASFLYGVTVTSATSVTLQSAPIDAEHIPQSGQVVEILMPAAQLANGQYAAAPSGQIFTLGASAYDPDTQILTLPNSLTDSLYGDGTSKNPSPPQLFLRVWQGSLPITPGTAQTLPNTGIQVTLTSTNANHVFRAGDAQNPQPPEGPREWICPLAVLLWTSTPPTAPSCRNPFDNLVELTAGDQGGCCSVYVTAAGHNQGTFTLQEAVSQVLSTGGRICLGPGTFNLTSTVEITGATLAIEIGGMGSSALFSTSPGVTTLALAAPPTPQTAAVPAILISGCQGVTIQDLNLTFAPGYTAQINNATGGQTTAYPNPGIMIQNSDSVTIQRCTLSCSGNQLPTNPAIAIAGLVREITIENNIIQFTLSANPAVPALGAGFGITNLPPIGDTQGGVSCLTFDLWINDNVLANVSFGIELDATCYHLGQVGISGNLIGPSGNAILVAGSGLPPLFTSVDISRNQVVESFSGIACGLAARICDNDLTLLPVATPAAGDAAIGGIVITAPVLSSDQIDGLQITGNRITGGSGFGILIEAPLGSAAIANNVLEGVACGGIYAMAGANHLSITNNQLINLVPNSNDPGVGAMAGAYGILLAPATSNGSAVQAGYVEILGNLIQNFATDATQTTVGSTPRYAIALQGYTSTVIADNHLINLGPTGHATDTSAGIYASAYPFDRIDISRNVIRLNDSTTADLTSSTWYGVYLSGFVRERIKVETGANLLNEKIIPTSDTQFVAVSQLGGKLVNAGGLQNVSLGGNFIEGAGRLSPVQIDVGGSCLFTSNQCSLTTRGNDEAIPIASLTATGVVASNNILLSAGKETAGLVITTTSTLKPQNFTVLGNITTGTIAVNGAGLSATLAALNVVE